MVPTGGSVVIPGNITTSIVRAADTTGSAVKVSWVYNDGYTGNADVYTVSGTSDGSVNIFSTGATKWIKEFSNMPSPITDNDQVGKGTQKFYKVVETGTALTTNTLTNDVVGKFDIVMTSGFNLSSIPLIFPDSSITKVFGSQMQSGAVPPLADKIYSFKTDKTGYGQYWFNSADNKWYDAETMAAASVVFNQDASYWIELGDGHTSAIPTFVGNVSTINRSISISAGFNFTGSSFPVNIGIESSHLRQSGATAGTVPPLAAKVYSLKDDKSGFSQIWLNSADNKWYDAETMTALNMNLKPGKGYIVEEVDGIIPYTWQYTKPY